MPILQCPQCEAPIVVKENLAPGEFVRCGKCNLEFALRPKAEKASRGPRADALRQAAQTEKPPEGPPADDLEVQPLEDGTYGERPERRPARGSGKRPPWEMPIARKKPRKRIF
jgi:predicted Zn finger-like uncharacterized protein